MLIHLWSLILQLLLGLDFSLHIFSAILMINPPFFSFCCCSRLRIRFSLRFSLRFWIGFWIGFWFASNSAALASHCTEFFLPAQKFEDAGDSHLVRSLLPAQINLKMIEQIAHE